MLRCCRIPSEQGVQGPFELSYVVDSHIVMYAAGAAHSHKGPSLPLRTPGHRAAGALRAAATGMEQVESSPTARPRACACRYPVGRHPDSTPSLLTREVNRPPEPGAVQSGSNHVMQLHRSAPGGIRTPNRPGRNRLLYPLSYGRRSRVTPRADTPILAGVSRPIVRVRFEERRGACLGPALVRPSKGIF